MPTVGSRLRKDGLPRVGVLVYEPAFPPLFAAFTACCVVPTFDESGNNDGFNNPFLGEFEVLAK